MAITATGRKHLPVRTDLAPRAMAKKVTRTAVALPVSRLVNKVVRELHHNNPEVEMSEKDGTLGEPHGRERFMPTETQFPIITCHLTFQFGRSGTGPYLGQLG